MKKTEKDCAHADEKGRCTHENHKRIGHLAPMIGEHPACVLLFGGSCADFECVVNTTSRDVPNSWRRMLETSNDGGTDNQDGKG